MAPRNRAAEQEFVHRQEMDRLEQDPETLHSADECICNQLRAAIERRLSARQKMILTYHWTRDPSLLAGLITHLMDIIGTPEFEEEFDKSCELIREDLLSS
jgi:hypothetical protein